MQDTFSIVAIDPITGKVGSAGASCIGGSMIISDIHPGLGGIHTHHIGMPITKIMRHHLWIKDIHQMR